VKIELEVNDVASRTMLMGIVEHLPSLTPEQRAEKARELGEEPLCKENIHTRIFQAGLHVFLKHTQDPAETIMSAAIKADLLATYTNMTRKLVDTFTLHKAKEEALRKEKGANHKDAVAQGHVVTGISLVVAALDSEITGNDRKDLAKVVTRNGKPAKKRKARKAKK